MSLFTFDKMTSAMIIPELPAKKEKKIPQRKLFSPEEDAFLKFLVMQYGTKDFKKIASFIPGRTPRQVRERYKNYLSPEINNGPWSRDEDALLKAKYEELGPKWSKIAEFFPHRSDINVKNRWTSIGYKPNKLLTIEPNQNYKPAIFKDFQQITQQIPVQPAPISTIVTEISAPVLPEQNPIYNNCDGLERTDGFSFYDHNGQSSETINPFDNGYVGMFESDISEYLIF